MASAGIRSSGSQSGNRTANPTILGSVSLIVPVGPSTCSSALCHARRPASVSMNDWIRNGWRSVLEGDRHRRRREFRRRSLDGRPPCLTLSTPVTPPARPLREPTDSSASARGSRRTTPIEISATPVIWSVRFVRVERGEQVAIGDSEDCPDHREFQHDGPDWCQRALDTPAHDSHGGAGGCAVAPRAEVKWVCV